MVCSKHHKTRGVPPGITRLTKVGFFIPLILLFLLAACAKPAVPSSTTGKTTGTTVNSTQTAATDPVVTLRIQSAAYASVGSGVWRLDVLIENALSGNNLPTPVNDSLGKVVTVTSDQDLSSFKVNDVVNAKIKDVGDVDLPAAVVLYIYDVVKP